VAGPLTAVTLIPTISMWLLSTGGDTHQRPPAWVFVAGPITAVGLAGLMWVGGNRVTMRLAAQRRQRLTQYLADVDLG